jgi:hypothetical protein
MPIDLHDAPECITQERRRLVGLTRDKATTCESDPTTHAHGSARAQSRSQTGAPAPRFAEACADVPANAHPPDAISFEQIPAFALHFSEKQSRPAE